MNVTGIRSYQQQNKQNPNFGAIEIQCVKYPKMLVRTFKYNRSHLYKPGRFETGMDSKGNFFSYRFEPSKKSEKLERAMINTSYEDHGFIANIIDNERAQENITRFKSKFNEIG